MKKLILAALLLCLTTTPTWAAKSSIRGIVASVAAIPASACNTNAKANDLYLVEGVGWYRCDSATDTMVPFPGSGGSIPTASVTAGVSRVEGGEGSFKTVFTVASSLVSTDAGASGAKGSIQLWDFPDGQIRVLGATSDLALLAGAGGIADTAAIVCALGTATAAADATLTSTEADIVASTTATLTDGAGACDMDMAIALDALLDGTGTAKDMFFNFAMPDAGTSADDTLAVAGTVTIVWTVAGDN